MNNQNSITDNTPKNSSVQTSERTTVDDIRKKIKVEEIEAGIFRATTDSSNYIIEYDMNKCIGAASCAVLAPLTFFMNEENRAEIKDDGTWDNDELILSAAESCPVLAIKIIDKRTEDIIFPVDDI